jgi:hypothetical protein
VPYDAGLFVCDVGSCFSSGLDIRSVVDSGTVTACFGVKSHDTVPVSIWSWEHREYTTGVCIP